MASGGSAARAGNRLLGHHQEPCPLRRAGAARRALYPFTSHWALRFSTTVRPSPPSPDRA
ncbi:DUF6193 family natural product biosynthesis protein [Streptomyces sp. NPDC054838]